MPLEASCPNFKTQLQGGRLADRRIAGEVPRRVGSRRPIPPHRRPVPPSRSPARPAPRQNRTRAGPTAQRLPPRGSSGSLEQEIPTNPSPLRPSFPRSHPRDRRHRPCRRKWGAALHGDGPVSAELPGGHHTRRRTNVGTRAPRRRPMRSGTSTCLISHVLLAHSPFPC